MTRNATSFCQRLPERPIRDPRWLVGLLEGEGCFTITNNSVKMAVAMTDLDVMERAATEMEAKLNGPYKNTGSRKPFWSATLAGPAALSRMVELYGQFGNRRRAKIEELLSWWEHR